ncbi:MAG: hypothetical protein LBT55_00345 [Clostridiaceae bacterium]|jgi:hypothetical protein|nr:hypothetical protein [Clostridiaceae bacterium]
MKILYNNMWNEKRLQELQIVEQKTYIDECEIRTEAYRILNVTTDFLIDAMNTVAAKFADVLKENGLRGDTLKHSFNTRYFDERLEESQTIYFGGNCMLETAERDAFWETVNAAFERGDGLFNVEEWYADYKREEAEKYAF